MNRLLLSLLLFSFSCAHAQEAPVITIHAVGDIMYGTLFPEKRIPPDNGRAIFHYAADALSNGSPDIVFGNLEGPITHQPETVKNVASGRSYAFRMPPDNAWLLTNAGFNVLNTCNNHSGDFGEEGYAESRRILRKLGILPVGNKGEVAVTNVRGTRIGFISFFINDSFNNMNAHSAAMAEVRRAKTLCDVLFVTMHAGGEGDKYVHVSDRHDEFLGEDRGDVLRFSHGAVDNGADIVIGSGPHVVRAMEVYRKKFIAFSLGNFATYQMATSGYKKYSLVLRVQIGTNGDFVGGEIRPLMQSDSGDYSGVPMPDPQGRTVKLVQKLQWDDLPGNPLTIGDDGKFSVLDADEGK
jgi:poly-gamma-glutamate capsule biosynthesis protein CapA/YwtB (metallophosphatase superfamily)